MGQPQYLMEHAEEARRLDLKTEGGPVFRQALWAGIKPGMRVADMGCGSGKTSYFLHQLVQPAGEVMGVDGSRSRIKHAQESYGAPGLSFACRDLAASLGDLGTFDFIWVRFVLEYHRKRSPEIVGRLAERLNDDGILFLADLDHNCLNHHKLPDRLDTALKKLMLVMEKEHDFDPYAGRKLYGYLYDLGFQDIEVELEAHHLIYGPLEETDRYNWTQKLTVAAQRSGYRFPEYPAGYREFQQEFLSFFSDPRRFTYTPLICCRGRKPVRLLKPRS